MGKGKNSWSSYGEEEKEMRKKIVKKKTKKFPDYSKDGKVTKKDILMGRGVIPKPKAQKKKKVVRKKKK